MENESKIYTFFDLLNSNFQIEIPKVQRDYAQGREDTHAKEVLETLLNDIKSALYDQKSEQLQLQFVYGKVENNKFIPVDGQQRLTTLYLLYLYAFRDVDSKTDILKKFSYETRRTSRDFLKGLLENRKIIFNEFSSKNSGELKDIIIDAAWFNPLAKYDPTVMAMMNALNKICECFKDNHDLAKKLMDNDNKKVVFNFLDMDELGMEDSLYIKLNARGKQLSRFENFKASLFERLDELSEYDEQEKRSILIKFDNGWTDIFWEKSIEDDENNNKELFDEIFEKFFEVLITNLNIFEDNQKKDILRIDFNKIDKKFFDTLIYLLDYIGAQNTTNNGYHKEIYERVIGILKEKYTYEDIVFFHIIVKFVQMSKGEIQKNSIAFERWIRVFSNMIYNTKIDQEELRKRAISSIDKISEYWNCIYDFLIDRKNAVDFFEKNQVEEERRKIDILLEEEKQNSYSFTTVIINAEKHKYFSGQIRSALYRSFNGSNYDLTTFMSYWKIIDFIFDDEKPRNGIDLSHALLTYGDYRLTISSYKTLCVDLTNDSASTYSMKDLFSGKDLLNSNTKIASDNIVTELLDALIRINPNNKTDIDNEINKIIDSGKRSLSQDDWRWCLINYSSLYNIMKHRRMRDDYSEALLIKNTQSNGINPNLFLAVICKEMSWNIYDVEIYPQKGVSCYHPLYFYSGVHKKWFYIHQEMNNNLVCIKIYEEDTHTLIQTYSGLNMISDALEDIKKY